MQRASEGIVVFFRFAFHIWLWNCVIHVKIASFFRALAVLAVSTFYQSENIRTQGIGKQIMEARFIAWNIFL